MSDYKVCYNPNAPYGKSEYCLETHDNKLDAIASAIEISKTYYGEVSEIWVKLGRKKVFGTR